MRKLFPILFFLTVFACTDDSTIESAEPDMYNGTARVLLDGDSFEGSVRAGTSNRGGEEKFYVGIDRLNSSGVPVEMISISGIAMSDTLQDLQKFADADSTEAHGNYTFVDYDLLLSAYDVNTNDIIQDFVILNLDKLDSDIIQGHFQFSGIINTQLSSDWPLGRIMYAEGEFEFTY